MKTWSEFFFICLPLSLVNWDLIKSRIQSRGGEPNIIDISSQYKFFGHNFYPFCNLFFGHESTKPTLAIKELAFFTFLTRLGCFDFISEKPFLRGNHWLKNLQFVFSHSCTIFFRYDTENTFVRALVYTPSAKILGLDRLQYYMDQRHLRPLFDSQETLTNVEGVYSEKEVRIRLPLAELKILLM